MKLLILLIFSETLFSKSAKSTSETSYATARNASTKSCWVAETVYGGKKHKILKIH